MHINSPPHLHILFQSSFMCDLSHKLLLWILCVKNHSHIFVGHVINSQWGGSKMEGVNFHCFISFIWHLWLMTVTWMSNCHYKLIKKWLLIIWYEHRQTHPPAYLHTYPPTHLSMYLLTYPPTHVPTYHILTYPPTHFLQHAYLFTYLLLIISYN
jgi:hypothetical protein